MKEITVFYSYWPTNIGNAFIDLGSIQSIKLAVPSCLIHTVSGFSRLLSERRSRNHLVNMLETYNTLINRTIKSQTIKKVICLDNRIHIKEHNVGLQNCIDLGRAIKSDFAVFSGMILYDYFLKQHESTIMKLKKKNVKIIFNGVGGAYFSEDEINRIRKLLKEFELYALISRDEKTFKIYHDLAEHSYNGIDCGFFISDYFKPIKLELPEYIILNFDKFGEPNIAINDKMIVRTHHWSPYYRGFRQIPKKYFMKPNTLISDSPDDYLALYSNTFTTFSDRIHACVATLSFGRPAKLYIGEDAISRVALFDKVGANTIESKITNPDMDKIRKEKEAQGKFLSEIFINK